MNALSENKSAFARYHPIVSFIYFTLVLVFTMFSLHPICLAISFVCAISYIVRLKTFKKIKTYLMLILPIMLICAFINPLFNHQGLTVLTYFPSGNPLTLESIYYGLAAAVMLAAIISWFLCLNQILCSDKFIYLFGKIIPAFALIFALVLSFIPRFIEQAKSIAHAQKCLGRDLSSGSVWQRAKLAIKILSILITWSFEKAIETADSMKSRGYGQKNRSSFTLYCWEKRDKTALVLISIFGLVIIIGAISGVFIYDYFPAIDTLLPDLTEAVVFLCFFFLCSTPLFIEVLETLAWRKMQFAKQ